MKMWIVDAFTDSPYSGNPAAVTIVDKFPGNEICQKIAAEMNLSETCFIKHLEEDTFHLRWFTPTAEVKLCGHGTLASAHILYQEKLVKDKEITFKTLSGMLKVQYSSSTYTLDLPLSAGEAAVDPLAIAKCNFGNVITALQIDDDVLVELSTEEEVRNYVPRPSDIVQIVCRLVIITSKGTGQYDFISRCFAPRVGVLEDPVTGSAHCKLALYWQRKLNKSVFTAYQASKRGGEIGITVVGDRVYQTGKAVTVMTGEWHGPLSTGK